MELDLGFSLSKTDKLLKTFEGIHNYLYANDGLSTQQTLEEIVKILFLKIVDERKEKHLFKISKFEYESLNQNTVSHLFINRINTLFSETIKDYSELFDASEKINLSVQSLAHVVLCLQDISLSESTDDAKGLAFQKFLSHHEKDGRGQFFTPEPVIKFCVQMISPQINETIIDPACGSGGFLFSAYQYVKQSSDKFAPKSYISKNIYGFDINKDIARISKMKLMLEAIISPNIICVNSLSSEDYLWHNIPEIKKKNGFDIVLTNPPFGTAGKITDKNILKSFDLGYKWVKEPNSELYIKTNKLLTNQVAEVLFIERCLNLLKEGGRMAIVLPNGHFENPSLGYLRYYIKLRSKLLAIVNLPSDTFIPYGTGVKTSLLFLEKNSLNQEENYPVFFSKIEKVGYQGNKNGTVVYQKDKFGFPIKDSFGKRIVDEDFSLVAKEYNAFQNKAMVKLKKSFIANYNEVNGRFDYKYYAPANRTLINKIKSTKHYVLKDVVEIIKVKSKKLAIKDSKVQYVELADINTSSFEIINSTEMSVYDLPSRASYELKENDIITAIAGNSIGSRKHATALVDTEYSGFICTNGFRVLRNPKIDLYFLLFYLKSDFFLRQIRMLRTGAAIPNISDQDFQNILIAIPTEKEMGKISESVKHSIELRKKSKEQFATIEIKI